MRFDASVSGVPPTGSSMDQRAYYARDPENPLGLELTVIMRDSGHGRAPARGSRVRVTGVFECPGEIVLSEMSRR